MFEAILSAHGYRCDSENGIWRRPSSQDIMYSDGDLVEERIKGIIKQANDVSVLSSELASKIDDWPTLYHLGANRANLLRPFAKELRGKQILEIGSGCGAVTRYLGECGGNVLAVEGTSRRAEISRLRCRDLPNVSVVNERFQDLSLETSFDIITLVGVLEYANLYTSGKKPFVIMLDQVKRYLKPNGHLIIAIENQLGLKYFSGAPEDHIGIPMYGLEGRYQANQAKTFGKHRLQQILLDSGFQWQKFWFPFPDYKHPEVIVTETAFADGRKEVLPLVQGAVRRSPQKVADKCFDEALVWKSVVKNKLGEQFANSFLIVASHEKDVFIDDTGVLAYHYSTRRQQKYCKELKIEVENDQAVVMHRRSLGNDPVAKYHSSFLEWEIEKTEHFCQGVLFADLFYLLTRQNNWQLDTFITELKRYVHYVEQKIARESGGVISDVHSMIPGRYVDLIPQNVIVHEDGSWHAIDQEWKLNQDFAFGWLLFRAILQIIINADWFADTGSLQCNTREYFIIQVFEKLGYPIKKEDIDIYMELENRFSSEVLGYDYNPDWGAELAVCSELSVLRQKEKLEREIMQLKQRNAELEEVCQQCFSSLSWKITAPVRNVSRYIKKFLKKTG